MHALTEMTRQLRQKKKAGNDSKGLVLANGGVLSYQHVVILSSSPREDNSPYPSVNPLVAGPLVDPAPQIEEEARGAAIIEVRFPLTRTICIEPHSLTDSTKTYTVEYARDGAPSRGHIVGRLASNNNRFLANHADEQTLRALSSMADEQIGRRGTVWTTEGGRNVFSIGEASKL